MNEEMEKIAEYERGQSVCFGQPNFLFLLYHYSSNVIHAHIHT